LIDTLRCARHLLDNSPYHRLQYLRYSLELYKNELDEANKHNITIKAHDAIGDVLVMKLLLSKLVALAKEQFPQVNTMQTLVSLTKQPIFIKTFKFGKYKGRSIEEICDEDIGYINWFMKSLELDEDMKYTLDKIMGHIE
jgi:exodeoxyribonuclease X